MKSKNTTSGIFSLGLVDGDMQQDWLESERPAESSPEARHASHSAPPGNGKATPTSDTWPQFGSTWSQPSGLLGCLASRLQPQSEKTIGSMIYSMHWKQKVTPRGRAYCQLVASGRRTSDSDFGWWHGWVTASSRDWKDTAGMATEGREGRNRLDQLPRQAYLAGWPTPNANKHTKNSKDPQKLKENGVQTALADAAWIAGWPTPRSQDAKHSAATEYEMRERLQKHPQLHIIAATAEAARIKPDGTTLTGSTAGMESGGQLNPAHSRWLMGYPP